MLYSVETNGNGWSWILGPDGYREGPIRYRWEAEEWAEEMNNGKPPPAEQGWNRCDVCGRFIAMSDFNKGARRKLVYPDSELTSEAWETLCVKHGIGETASKHDR